MSNAIFLDTNTLIDAAVPQRPQHVEATLLFNQVAYGRLQAYVASSSLKDCYYILRKVADDATVRAHMRDLLELASVVPVDLDTCITALDSNERDFEDGVIRACAEGVGASYIVSRDEGAFANGHIKRLSPHEYVALFVDHEEVLLRGAEEGGPSDGRPANGNAQPREA